MLSLNKSAREEWERAVEESLPDTPERKEEFTTPSGIPIKRLYEPSDAESIEKELGYPGFYPFTRGVQPTMYRGRLWTMRQYSGFGTAEESNQRYRYLLSQGQTGLSVAFDLPTQIGYDSDDPEAAGEVGRVGVAISSLEDMEHLFRDIPLERISTSMTISATAAIALAFYIAMARKMGCDEKRLEGTVQNDILKEYVARGTYIYPPRPSMHLVTDIIVYCKDALPKWNSISISGYHIREAGATAVQELAFTFANAMAYVEATLARGIGIDEFAPRLSFFWDCHSNFFEEIAKFRAARRLWARWMKERYGAKNPRSQMLRFHTQTAGCSLTAQQPENNAVRVALQALAAVLGETQSLHTNARDEALSLPSEASARLALRTQQIIAYESGVADTIDPLAGSYFVEALTREIEQRTEVYLETIDKIGGAVAAVEAHYFQEEISREAYRHQKEIESGQRLIVGVNRFVEETGEEPLELPKVDPLLEEKRRKELRELRAKRDKAKVENALRALKRNAQTDENLMPILIDCALCQATLGEISNALREVWGEYKE
ncbi:MAG: methylmalonyl-CoA mutase family protein [bacterium]